MTDKLPLSGAERDWALSVGSLPPDDPDRVAALREAIGVAGLRNPTAWQDALSRRPGGVVTEPLPIDKIVLSVAHRPTPVRPALPGGVPPQRIIEGTIIEGIPADNKTPSDQTGRLGVGGLITRLRSAVPPPGHPASGEPAPPVHRTPATPPPALPDPPNARTIAELAPPADPNALKEAGLGQPDPTLAPATTWETRHGHTADDLRRVWAPLSD